MTDLFPLTQVAYSIPESFLTLRWMDHTYFSQELGNLPEGLYLRIVHGIGRKICFRLIPLKDNLPLNTDEYTIEISAGGVTIRRGNDALYLTLERADTLTIAGKGLGIRLDMPPAAYEYVAQYGENRCLVNTSASRTQFMLEVQQGALSVDAPYGTQCCEYIYCDFTPDYSGSLQLTCDQFEKIWKASPHLADACSSMKQNQSLFESFCSDFPSVCEEDRSSAILARFILWSAVIPPHNMVKRRGVLMSNNWMINVWGWDSAINAMGLSLGDPALAYDQLVFPYDYQTEEGLIPDYVNPYEIMWNFTKPPIHGIAYLYFLKEQMSDSQVADLYTKMSAQVSYWMEQSATNGIPHYHHGNDCGWDNCTPFEVGAPVEGPDLSAYIIMSMLALADMAERIGKKNAAKEWKESADAMLNRFLEHCWDGERFQVYQAVTHKVSPRGHSLYPYLPLVLGHYLPREIFNKMTAQLQQDNYLLTSYGLATESISSPCYDPDGYWRGPIWAPAMLLLILGIHDGGDPDFAGLLARRFIRACKKGGMAENFNALTGEGLRDPAYTWTSAAYLVLTNRYPASEYHE